MLNGGIVDYCVAPRPNRSFVVVHEENLHKKTQLAYYKLATVRFMSLHAFIFSHPAASTSLVHPSATPRHSGCRPSCGWSLSPSGR